MLVLNHCLKKTIWRGQTDTKKLKISQWLSKLTFQIYFDLKSNCIRNSHRRCSVKKGVFRNFTKFTGKNKCQSLFFLIKLQALLKKRLWHRSFPVNFAKFLRKHFLQNTYASKFCEINVINVS